MKKYRLLLVVFVVTILTACSSGQSALESESVIIYKMKSFSNVDFESMKAITNSDEIAVLQTAIKNAVKQPGIVNMVDPEYMVEVDESSFYLWIEEEAGTIMNVEDTHTIYSLEKQNAKEVKRIIDFYFH